MRSFAWWSVVFVLSLWMPHVPDPFRLPYLALYGICIAGLLWRGIRRDDERVE